MSTCYLLPGNACRCPSFLVYCPISAGAPNAGLDDSHLACLATWRSLCFKPLETVLLN